MSEPLLLSNNTSWLRKAAELPSIAFGDSMLPFVKPLAPIRIRRVPVEEIRVGDIVAYRANGSLIAHRVVKIASDPAGVVLLTKGDNRVQRDPLLRPGQILGLVTRVGSCDLTRRRARSLSRWIAALSYIPYAASSRLIRRLPRGRRLATRCASALQPLPLWNRLVNRQEMVKIRQRRGHFISRRIEARIFRDDDTGPLVDLWNRCFPGETMEPDAFRSKIRRSPWFSPSGCLVAAQGSRLVGLAVTSRRWARPGGPAQTRGFIECIGVDPAVRRQGVGSLLLDRALQHLRAQGCRSVETGPFRVPCAETGETVLEAGMAFFARNGFEIMFLGQEFRHLPHLWHPRGVTQRLIPRLRAQGVEIRTAQEEDRAVLADSIRRWGYPQGANLSGGLEVERMQSFVVATREGRIIGTCRWHRLDRLVSYDEVGWIWAAAARAREVGYVGGLYVDPRCRALNVGAAMTAQALDAVFESGCGEVRGWAASPGLQTRYRRWGLQRVGGVLSMVHSF